MVQVKVHSEQASVQMIPRHKHDIEQCQKEPEVSFYINRKLFFFMKVSIVLRLCGCFLGRQGDKTQIFIYFFNTLFGSFYFFMDVLPLLLL